MDMPYRSLLALYNRSEDNKKKNRKGIEKGKTDEQRQMARFPNDKRSLASLNDRSFKGEPV